MWGKHSIPYTGFVQNTKFITHRIVYNILRKYLKIKSLVLFSDFFYYYYFLVVLRVSGVSSSESSKSFTGLQSIKIHKYIRILHYKHTMHSFPECKSDHVR